MNKNKDMDNNPEAATQYLVRTVLEETAKVREDSERKLKNALAPIMGNEKAEDIANYFFGHPANMTDLTLDLLRSLDLIKR
jgi:hypothetical protein